MALISDAGHNFSDVIGLLLSLVAFKLMQKKKTRTFTYGYKKATILSSFLNALLLFVAVGYIIFESIRRFENPQVLEGNTVAVVAFVGILINGFTAFLFLKDQKKDLNIKGAYLHMVADMLVSVGVLIGGLVISSTGWYFIDPIIGIIIAVVIFIGTWKLFKDSLRLSLDGVPMGVETAEVIESMKRVEGVRNISHVHLWALSTTQNALTAHVLVDKGISREDYYRIKNELKAKLEDFHIDHSTLEFSDPDKGEKENCL